MTDQKKPMFNAKILQAPYGLSSHFKECDLSLSSAPNIWLITPTCKEF